jgi:hypothetical protein
MATLAVDRCISEIAPEWAFGLSFADGVEAGPHKGRPGARVVRRGSRSSSETAPESILRPQIADGSVRDAVVCAASVSSGRSGTNGPLGPAPAIVDERW